MGSFSINSNIPAYYASKNLAAANKLVGKSLQQLSSGLRINTAADDPAGLTISEKLRAQVNGLNRASMNAQDGISMLQTAEGALSTTTSILQRMRELSVQAANGTYTANDRIEIQKEIDQLIDEVDRIATSTEFNTKKLLDGTSSALWSTDSPAKIEAIINGKVDEGNYRIEINTDPGVNQVWKSDVMTLKEGYDLTASLSVTEDVEDLTSITVTNSSGITQDYDYNVEWVAGQSAEIYGSNTIASTSISISGVSSPLFEGTTSAVTVRGYEVVGTSTVSITWDDGATAVTASFTDGMVITASALNTLFDTAAGEDLEVADVGGAGFSFSVAATVSGTLTFNSAAASLFGVSSTAYTVSDGGAGSAITTLTTTRDAENVKGWAASVSGTTTTSAYLTFRIEDMGTSTTVSAIFSYLVNGKENNGADYDQYFSERGVIDKINAAISAAGTSMTSGIRAEIDNNDQLNIIGGDASGIRISSVASGLDTSADTLDEIYGLTEGSSLASAGNKIRLSVNNGTINSVSIASGSYTVEDLAQAIEDAVNAAVTAGTTTQENYVDVFVGQTTAAATNNYLIMNTKKIGSDAEISIDFGLQNEDALGEALGWDVQNHALGRDDGVALRITDANATTQSAESALATHVYNYRNYIWTAGGGGTQQEDLAVSEWTDAMTAATTLSSSDIANGAITLNFDNAAIDSSAASGSITVDYTKAGTSYIARRTDKLGAVTRFYDTDGNAILENAQELTLYGNGKQTTILVDRGDTLDEFAQKIRDAVAFDLDMAIDSTSATSIGTVDSHIAEYIAPGEATKFTDEAVEGTLVIRSPQVGEGGALTFAGEEDLIKALSLAEIQSPVDETGIDPITVTIKNAHTGETIGEDVFSSPKIENLLNGVDVKVAPTLDVKAAWDDTNKKFSFSNAAGTEVVNLHLVDTSIDLQIGANEGQMLNAYIGQMDSSALGVDDVKVVSQDLASEAITTIDNAINSVSSERARMGAYMNRLDMTIDNLGIQSENLMSADSQIRDLDVAQAMIDFTKAQVLAQTSIAMLSQANQIPMMALQLLR